MTLMYRAVTSPAEVDGVGSFASHVDDDEIARRSGFKADLAAVSQRTEGERLSVIVGIGRTPDLRSVRIAAGAMGRALQHCERVAVTLPTIEGSSAEAVARAVAEGIGLGVYRFTAHKSDSPPAALTTIEIVSDDDAAAGRGLAVAAAMIDATNLARDLANETPARMTARRLADVCVSLAAEHGLGVEIWDEARIVDERLGCLTAVNAGSIEPARVIRLEHSPDNAIAHLVFVGKGITFDSGGLSLKKPEWMYDMKGDMGGAAAVIAALRACADLEVRVRVTGFVVATDNLPGPHATKPGEIVTARNGTTVEILDTDAEGRLVLADGLCLAAELEPDAIVDVATLTGYARVLGTHLTPVMSNDDGLAERIAAASTTTGERTWRLPVLDDFVEALESPWADLRNIPDPDDAGTTAPAVFLRHFVGDRRWAHLDIGETGFATKTHGETVKGCTGVMARTLVELARDWS